MHQINHVCWGVLTTSLDVLMTIVKAANLLRPNQDHCQTITKHGGLVSWSLLSTSRVLAERLSILRHLYLDGSESYNSAVPKQLYMATY